jgi:hypothetical protein
MVADATRRLRESGLLRDEVALASETAEKPECDPVSELVREILQAAVSPEPKTH